MGACCRACPRYAMLLLLCCMKFVLFFCIEIPSGLQGAIVRIFDIDSRQYNLLFSSQCWADILLSIIGGVLVDKCLGIKAGLLLFIVIALMGKIIFIAGAVFDSYLVLLAGRFVMGCGIGSSNNIQNVILSHWFKKEVVFAMAFTFASCRVGAAMGLVLPRLMYESINMNLLHLGGYATANQLRLAFTFSLGLALLILAVFAGIAVVILDTRVRKCQRGDSYDKKNRLFSYRDLKDFSPRFWLSAISCTMFYGVLFIFVANGQMFFVSKFRFGVMEANTANFLIFAAPVIATPIFGTLIQLVGYNITWGIAGSLLAMISHVLFNAAGEQPILPYFIGILFSISYSFFGISIYPIPALIVQAHQLTTAYGIYNTLYSIMITVVGIISGTIIDEAGYMWLEIYFFFLLYSILCLLVVVGIMDQFSRTSKVNVAGSWLREQIEYWKFKQEDKKIQEVVDYYSGDFEHLYHH